MSFFSAALTPAALTAAPRLSPPPEAAIIRGRVATMLRAQIDTGQLAGAVALVARDGEILLQDAFGLADLTGSRAMQKEDLFWVASMTKPITAAAILMLAEEGRLSLADPVEKHLPAFKDAWLVSERTPERQLLTRPTRPVLIRDLLMHTHGLAEIPIPPANTPLAAWVDEVGRAPRQFEPGAQWRYGNAGMNTLGRIVEVVSGTSFESFLQTRIFDPLGMRDTTFFPDEAQLRRLAKSYRMIDGRLRETPITLLHGDLASPNRTVFPGGGLFSTAPDMLRFYQVLLDGGVCGDGRLLSAETAKEMVRAHTGDFEAGFSAGMGWGLGVGVVRHPVGWTAVLPVGTYGHDGAYGTTVMIEPRSRLVMILMIQRAGLDPAKDGLRFRHAFHVAVLGST